MLPKFVSVTNLACVLAVVYLAVALNSLYLLANPLWGIDEAVLAATPKIAPLWHSDTRYNIYAWMSVEATFPATFSVDAWDAMDKDLILARHSGLVHHDSQEDVSIQVTIVQDEATRVEHNKVVAAAAAAAVPLPVPVPVVKRASERIWAALHGNRSDVFLHVLAVRGDGAYADSGANVTAAAQQEGDALHGVVRMVKYDVIPKYFKHRYLLADLGSGWADEDPDDAVRSRMHPSTVISYFKPEVQMRLISDDTHYPTSLLPQSLRRRKRGTKSNGKYKPVFHVDEIGLTSDKYVPLNTTVRALSLNIVMGSMAPQRWRIMSHMEETLRDQQELGFTQKDIDDVRRLIADTSVYLLCVTLVASLLHLLFEVLAFSSDIHFWRSARSMAGLSTQAVLMELLSQIIIFFFLIESEASMLVLLPAGASIFVQVWKVWRALHFKWNSSECASEEEEKEEEDKDKDKEEDKEEEEEEEETRKEEDEQKKVANRDRMGLKKKDAALVRATAEADSRAMGYLLQFLLPIALAFMARALVMNKHRGWYGFFITALTGAVYAFGFAFMLPQLFINHQLKSVSHLPWNFLVYKCINTFIDDLFAFIIVMPTMHRISCFRDDVVFFVYVYQRYIYRVDASRPQEK